MGQKIEDQVLEELIRQWLLDLVSAEEVLEHLRKKLNISKPKP